jgi:hypothetical protein
MTSVARPARADRKLLSDLRAARAESDQGRIVGLLKEIALVAPELQGAACEIVRGDDDEGADQRESWAAGFFIYTGPQLEDEQEPVAIVSPVVSKSLEVKRRKIPELPKPKSYAELKAEFEAENAKAQPEPDPEPKAESKPEPSTALVPVSNDLVVAPSSPDPGEAIRTMNDKHAVISNLGGKCVVMEWVPSMIMPRSCPVRASRASENVTPTNMSIMVALMGGRIKPFIG